MDSPRGRIHFLKDLKEGKVAWDATSASHFDSCLGCFACVTACPSGVRYDELLEEVRPILNDKSYRTPADEFFRRFLLALLPYPNRLRQFLRPLRLYPGSKLRRLLKRMGLFNLLGENLSAMESLLPNHPLRHLNTDLAGLYQHQGKFRGRVGLVLGCVQQVFGQQVNIAAINVLTANGYTVVVPASQGCCGAVTHHQGEIKETEEFARRMSKLFEVKSLSTEFNICEPLDSILVVASGCGHTMKNYSDILRGSSNVETVDSLFSGAQVLDIHEFLHKEGPSKEFIEALRPLEHTMSGSDYMRIVYHDACHMIHGQGIKEAPRELLRLIPKVEITEGLDSGVCCGSAGIYNLTHPEEGQSLGIYKAKSLLWSNPSMIASANIGCTLQIGLYTESENIPIKHPVEILNDSYCGLKTIGMLDRIFYD